MASNDFATLRTAQLLGITTSLFLSGSAFTYTYAAAPACLLAPPPIAAAQWETLYIRGRNMSPALGFVAAGFWIYCAQCTGETAYKVAAALVVANMPWTLAMMRKTNAEIGGMARKAGDEKKGRLIELVARWRWLNAVRVVLPGLGGMMGAWCALRG